MTRYMRADRNELIKVYRDLKREKWTLKAISESIGSDFRNALYKGRGLNESSFFKLENLVGYVIPTSFFKEDSDTQFFDTRSQNFLPIENKSQIIQSIAQD